MGRGHKIVAKNTSEGKVVFPISAFLFILSQMSTLTSHMETGGERRLTTPSHWTPRYLSLTSSSFPESFVPERRLFIHFPPIFPSESLSPPLSLFLFLSSLSPFLLPFFCILNMIYKVFLNLVTIYFPVLPNTTLLYVPTILNVFQWLLLSRNHCSFLCLTSFYLSFESLLKYHFPKQAFHSLLDYVGWFSVTGAPALKELSTSLASYFLHF